MRKINIDDAVDGMILVQGVEDSVGRPILRAGDVIKAKFIPQLKKWGVQTITVEGEDVVVAVEVTEESQETERAIQVDAQLEKRFALHPDESHMNTLKRSARKYLLLKKPKF
ncbi:MAG: hypothetical protein AB7F75_06345 [Planctomycetota bacterium]